METLHRQRAFLVTTSCLLASLALNELPFALSLPAFLVLALIAYTLARGSGFALEYLANPAVGRILAPTLVGLTVLAGFALGIGHFFAESVAPLVEEIWVISYLLAALHTLAPDVMAGLPKPLDMRSVYTLFFLLTALLGFLLGDLTMPFVAWVFGFWYLTYTLGSEGLLAPLAPQQLWEPGWRRLTTIGMLLAAMSLGLPWAQWSDYNYRNIPDWYVGTDNYWHFGFDTYSWYTPQSVLGHAQWIDLLPAAVLTGMLVWLAWPRARSMRVSGLLALFGGLALLLLYALVIETIGQSAGPKMFIAGLAVVAVGIWQSRRGQRTRGHAPGFPAGE